MQKKSVVGFLLLISACSGAASNGSRGQGSSGAAVGDGGASGSTATGSGAGGLDGTGNPTSTASTYDGGPIGDGGNCVVGQYCAPKNADSDKCGSLTLDGDVKTTEKPGNVLLIFDRSGSMADKWNGVTKWQAAGTALVQALTPIQDKLTIGAVNFPSPADAVTCNPLDLLNLPACLAAAAGTGCNVNPITAPDQITFKPGAQAVVELQTGGPGGTPKYETVNGSTPTSEGVQQADTALRGATLTGTTAVVIITDGEPNCSWNQQQTTTTIGNWLSQLHIKTYVVGLPGAVDGKGAAVLSTLAQAGGTPGAGGATDYILPTDPATLQKKLAEIVSKTVSTSFDSCTIHLQPVANVPDKLHLVVNSNGVDQDVPHMFGATQAWTISADGSTVDLLGDLCKNVKAGTYGQIRFEFGCVALPVLPPPPPPS
jgi:hypothetical protein